MIYGNSLAILTKNMSKSAKQWVVSVVGIRWSVDTGKLSELTFEKKMVFTNQILINLSVSNYFRTKIDHVIIIVEW